MLDGIGSAELIDRQSISDKVYHHVKALILSGVLSKKSRNLETHSKLS